MSTIVNPAQPAASNKVLWIVVAVLGAAVFGMGGVMLGMKSRPAEPVAVVAPPAPMVAAPVAVVPASAPAAPVVEEKAAKAQAESKPAATKSVAKPVTPKAAPAPAVAVQPPAPGNPPVVVGGGVSQPVVPAVVQAPPRPVCAICGTVESVTPVQRQGHASGAGVVAGGVLGAVVGNQVGSGNGKTLATILGGVAGGVAGNAVEKNMKKETVYAVRVHMEDGSTRSLELATPPAVGIRVTVEGSVMRGADGAVLSGPAPAQPRPQSTQPNPNTIGG